jgi:hypothetical protein
MKAKRDRHGDDNAITVALKESEVVTGSGYGDVPWGEWCYREMGRMNAKGGGGRVRIARGGGVMWLTRA